MKKYIFYNILALAMMMAGCQNENFIEDPDSPLDPENSGALVFADHSVNVAEYAEELSNVETKAPGKVTEAGDNYKVEITSVKTGEAQNFTYGELKAMPERKVVLAPGLYKIESESADYAQYMESGVVASWNNPVFYGTVDKEVVKKQNTNVDDLVCVLANIKSTVTLTEDLLNVFMSDSEAEKQGKDKLSVTLSVSGEPLVFDRTRVQNEDAAFFKAVEVSNTMTLTMKGYYNKSKVGGQDFVPITWTKEIPQCKAGQWRKIYIGLKDADMGNVEFEIIVENWVYDQKVDVDVMQLYTPLEEGVEDIEESDPDSPQLSLDGGNIQSGYTLSSAKFDTDMNKWKENMTLSVVPASGAKVASIQVAATSDNTDFINDFFGGDTPHYTIDMWPLTKAISSYVVFKQEGGAFKIILNDAGMSKLYSYKGMHNVKYIIRDDQGRTSYTLLKINVKEGGVIETGPQIHWYNKDKSQEFDFSQRYPHDQVEINIEVSTDSKFKGFEVDIISENVMTKEDLQGVGLDSHLDLINPATPEIGQSLNGLGFPTGNDITSKQLVSFDITNFMSLISMLNKEGDIDFKLTVTDESGVAVKSIQLNVKLK